MTLSEFKAWFEGYTEGLEAAPTKAQFDRIKEKVKEISVTPISYPVFIDRYRDYWQQRTPYFSYSAGSTSSGNAVGNAVIMNATGSRLPESEFDGITAMYALGKAEAAN